MVSLANITTSVNFFAGFIISSGSYYILCKIFPIPACADTWTEVGDEITDVTLAYEDGDSASYDEESGRVNDKIAESKAAEGQRRGYGAAY